MGKDQETMVCRPVLEYASPAWSPPHNKVLLVKDQTEMVAKQNMATCFSPNHPGNKQINKPRDPRVIKTTININKYQVAGLLSSLQQPDNTNIKADTTSNLAESSAPCHLRSTKKC